MGRVYLDWAVFPYVREANLGERGGHLVEFQDLRYTYPSSRGQAPLSGYVLLSPNLRVIEEGVELPADQPQLKRWSKPAANGRIDFVISRLAAVSAILLTDSLAKSTI